MRTVDLQDMRLQEIETRVRTLETGATAAILAQLEGDRAQRASRQQEIDRRMRTERILWLLVTLSLLADIALRLAER